MATTYVCMTESNKDTILFFAYPMSMSQLLHLFSKSKIDFLGYYWMYPNSQFL